MNQKLLLQLTQLEDEALLAALRGLLARHRRMTAQLVLHMSEVDARGLYRGEGVSSMFEYCTKVLHMSEAEAYPRIRVARLVKDYPTALEALAEGRLHLTALTLLAPVLNHHNAATLLKAAEHRTKRQVEVMLAARNPQPSVPSTVRKLPVGSSATAKRPSYESQPRPQFQPQSRCPTASTSKALRLSAPPPAVVKPLSAERFAVHFTADSSLHDKLRMAQDLLRHQVPNGDVAEVFGKALDVLIPQLMKQRFAQTDNPRKGASRKKAEDNSRHIPSDVKREVAKRDGMRCSYVSTRGRHCDERGWLEFDHADPFAQGGKATVDNIRLLCRAHNQLEAERTFGTEFMQRRRQQQLQLTPE